MLFDRGSQRTQQHGGAASGLVGSELVSATIPLLEAGQARGHMQRPPPVQVADWVLGQLGLAEVVVLETAAVVEAE